MTHSIEVKDVAFSFFDCHIDGDRRDYSSYGDFSAVYFIMARKASGRF